jgi:hypothetical protein
MIRLKLMLAFTLALSTAFAVVPGNVFQRVYKADEKQSYLVVMNADPISISADIDTTVVKVHNASSFGQGDKLYGADVKFHMSSKKETGTTLEAPMPEDLTVRMGANNLFDKFDLKMGSVDFLFLLLALAGATTDQLAGPEVVAVDWTGGQIAFKGTIKVLENTDGKTKAQIKGNLSIQGQDLGETDLTSTYDQPTKTLLESEGTMSFGMKAKLKITKKKA